MAKTKSRNVQTLVPEWAHTELMWLASHQDLTMSQLIRRILGAWLDDNSRSALVRNLLDSGYDWSEIMDELDMDRAEATALADELGYGNPFSD
jgi:hypothetical protein